jgi:hypothetical protein
MRSDPIEPAGETAGNAAPDQEFEGIRRIAGNFCLPERLSLLMNVHP